MAVNKTEKNAVRSFHQGEVKPKLSLPRKNFDNFAPVFPRSESVV